MHGTVETKAPAPPFGPDYPQLACVSKWRFKARNGLKTLPVEDRRAYGQAVLDAINAMNAKLSMRETPTHTVNCASRTNHNTGKKILAAIREQNKIKWSPAHYGFYSIENPERGTDGGLSLERYQIEWLKAEQKRQEARKQS